MGKQVEQPLQLGGTGLQVRGELRPGLRPAAAQRVKQLAVIVCGPAEFTAGALGQRRRAGRHGGALPAPARRRVPGGCKQKECQS
jgi:hypothetical protein